MKFRTGFPVALLFAFALLFGAVVHASEQVCQPAPCTEVEQAPDDQPRGDHGAIHQHGGCHGHHLASPALRADIGARFAALSPTIPAIEKRLAQAPPDQLLRPPTA